MKIGSFESKPATPASTTPAAGKPAAGKAGSAAPAAKAAAPQQPIKVPQGEPPVKASPTVKQAAAEPSAQVKLSSAAASQGTSGTSGTSGMNSSSDATFDTAKVERIAQAIRDGKFSINAEAIADKLIINAEELLGRKLSS